MVNHYPTVAEISSALTEQGVAVPSTLDQIVAAAISDFEQGTGYVPFLGSATEESRTYDPPYKAQDLTLNLKGGFWAIESVVISDVTLAAEYYDLLPLNAEADGRGYNEIRFRVHPGYEPASVVVTGKRGYAEELPDDVYQAIFDEAQRRAVLKSQSGGEQVSEVKQGLVTIKLASGSTSSLEDIESRYAQKVLDYRRFS